MFKENGITPITLEQYDMWYTGEGTIPEKSILITIDDGQPGTLDLAAPLLDEYGYTAISFEITSMWDNYDVKKETNSLELSSHTNDMHHGFCDGMTRAGIMQCTDVESGINDLVTSNLILEKDAIMFCYPFGGAEGTAYEIVKGAGFKYATTIEPGISSREDDPLLLPRVRVNGDTSAEMLEELLQF
jgi:peptidoglycan/xylan/chitin deacetylase (PgdA/CDA1 family)